MKRAALWLVPLAVPVLAILGGHDRIVRKRAPIAASPVVVPRDVIARPIPDTPPIARAPERIVPTTPRPSPEAAEDWRRLRRWLLDELSDADFARLLRGTEIEGYVAAILSRLLEDPREPGQPPLEMRLFLDRFNERVIVCERLDVSDLEGHP